MPVAVRYRLCCRVSACAGAFARNAISSAKSASVIVLAGYFLLLSFVSLKPFSLILSIDVLSTYLYVIGLYVYMTLYATPWTYRVTAQ